MILQWNVSCAQPYSRAKPSMAHICTRTAMGKGNNLCLAQAQARNVYWFKWPHNHILCRLYSSESWDVFCINKIVSGCIVSARLPLTVLWFCMPGRFPKVVSTGLCCWLYCTPTGLSVPLLYFNRIASACYVSRIVSGCVVSTRLSLTVCHVSVALIVTVFCQQDCHRLCIMYQWHCE